MSYECRGGGRSVGLDMVAPAVEWSNWYQLRWCCAGNKGSIYLECGKSEILTKFMWPHHTNVIHKLGV